MIADIDSGTVLNTITLKRGAKGVAIDTGKSISITSGLKELNLFDISSGSIISNIKDGDDFLTGIKLKGITDYLAGGGNDYINDSDINTDITSFLNLYNSEIDETIIGDLENAGSGLSYFQNDSTYGLDINPSTHIAVITGEESLLLLDLNTNTLNEYPITDINSLRSVAVDKYRNISLVSYLKDTAGDQPERGVLEVQLPNPVPRITEITPSGAAAGDTDVKLRIDGEGFIASSSVKFNRFDINTAFSGNNTLDAIVPSTFLSSAGIFPVTVTNPLPSGGVSDSFTFTVQNPVPLISTIDPPQAIAGTLGLAVNISGKGFINDTAIYVNGIQRTYTPISSTELKLSLVPADLQTGGHIEITASNPKPGGGISGNVTFMVLNSDSSAKSSDIITSLNTNLDLDEISKLDEKLPLAQNIPPLSDLGFDYDEQQGGGGLVGETIRVLNGNVLEYRNDLQFSSPNKTGLSLTAFYNSQSDVTGALGYGWTHTYEASLDTSYQFNNLNYIKITDGTGRGIFFEEISPGVYQAAFNERSTLTNVSGEYIWHRTDGSRYTFNSSGKLIRITDEKSNSLEIAYNANDLVSTVTDTSSGRTLTFNYNANNLLENITGPVTSAVTDGIWVQYGYDTNANLISVTYADGSGFNYAYTDTYDIHNLTEKKNNANHLLNTWSYDDLDRAINNFSVNGTGVSVVYIDNIQVEVTDAYGVLRTYAIIEAGGRKRVLGVSGIAEAPYSANNVVRWAYDANMNLIETEDAGGVINLYQNYDAKGNPATVILASGAPEQRTIIYTYHPDMNVPLTRMEVSVLGTGNKVTIWDYDDDYNSTPNQNPTGNLCRVIEQGFTADNTGATVAYEYITKITYNAKGQVLSIDGPVAGTADTSTFVYNLSSGDITSITRPLVGSSLFQNYDNAGQVGQTTDVNGHVSTYTYDGRGRATDVYHADDSSTASTTFNAAGFIESRTDEDSVNTGYTYDTTYGRLSRVTDHEGNYIDNLYDTQGNPTDKSYYDPAATRTNWKRFDYQHPAIPGKLYKEIKHDDSFMEYAYDVRGNVSSVTDFNGKTTSYTYDALNRLKTVTQPGNLITAYTYDGHGSLASVTDAKSQVTTYQGDQGIRVKP